MNLTIDGWKSFEWWIISLKKFLTIGSLMLLSLSILLKNLEATKSIVLWTLLFPPDPIKSPISIDCKLIFVIFCLDSFWIITFANFSSFFSFSSSSSSSSPSSSFFIFFLLSLIVFLDFLPFWTLSSIYAFFEACFFSIISKAFLLTFCSFFFLSLFYINFFINLFFYFFFFCWRNIFIHFIGSLLIYIKFFINLFFCFFFL